MARQGKNIRTTGVKHFLRIAEFVDTLPVLHSLVLNNDLWDENDLRTTHPETVHAETSDIWVFFNEITDDVINDIQTIPYRAWDVLLPLRPVIFDLMRRLGGTQLGRVLITRLKPGGKIVPHTDVGAPVNFYNRYMIALQNLPGSVFIIEDEEVTFKPGEVWWINNGAEHSVVNNSADDRIVCIVDIRI